MVDPDWKAKISRDDAITLLERYEKALQLIGRYEFGGVVMDADYAFDLKQIAREALK